MRRGFTLLEILLALAVIALLATVLVGTSASLLNRDRTTTPDDVFWKACQAARKSAVKTGNQVQLSFDDKAKAFILDNGSGPQSFALPGDTRGISVNFLSTQGDQSEVLIGGEAVETGTPPSVYFYSDGTCTPFKVQFVESGQAHVLAIDPWTCAAVLPKKDT